MKRKHKYGASKTERHGMSFSSKLEASLYDQLLLMQMAKEIKSIQVQDHVYLTDARIQYIADYKCLMADDTTEWFEAKGFETPVWRIKRRLWMHYGPGKLHIYMRCGSGLKLDETIIPKESE